MSQGFEGQRLGSTLCGKAHVRGHQPGAASIQSGVLWTDKQRLAQGLNPITRSSQNKGLWDYGELWCIPSGS